MLSLLVKNVFPSSQCHVYKNTHLTPFPTLAWEPYKQRQSSSSRGQPPSVCHAVQLVLLHLVPYTRKWPSSAPCMSTCLKTATTAEKKKVFFYLQRGCKHWVQHIEMFTSYNAKAFKKVDKASHYFRLILHTTNSVYQNYHAAISFVILCTSKLEGLQSSIKPISLHSRVFLQVTV